MGESTHEWSKRQKLSANAVCEDCGRKWTATLAEVPVTILIPDLDEYYEKLSNNLLEAVEPPMVLCVFRPSDRDISDTEHTLSCVAPRQDTPYHWRINHKHSGPAAASGCRIFPWRDKNVENRIEDSRTEPDIVTIKDEIKIEEDEEMVEEFGLDPLAYDKNVQPNTNTTTVSCDTISSRPRVIHQYHSSTNITPEPFGNRFVRHNQHDLDDLSALRQKKNTKNATRSGCKTFRNWLEARDQSPEFERLEKNELASLLQCFYGEVKKQDGSNYSKQSMISIRAAINRQLHSEEWERNFDIIIDSEFCRANHVLEGIFKDLTSKVLNIRKSHTSKVLNIRKSHCPLDLGDFRKLIETGTIGLESPIRLQNLVWLNICLKFGKRVLMGWKNLRKDMFIEGIDDQGKHYISVKENQKEKGTTATSHMPDARVYEQDGIELCPVKAIRLYISRLSPALDDMWQRPNELMYDTPGFWYCPEPWNKKDLGLMMSRICENAKLPVKHTNLCLRATSCTIMAEAGI